ncbi:spore protease YyaC [Gracilibacillus sp. YIM 98692]|uniref:spore protease YyaC n=1 Tax=Gracilibacillus sp. YIM 98692 TaxID=2663532 RepID=UPI0013D59AD3|nr:spore protease YyaC [Gracilibacillus sp. YIM 98692]
MNSQRLSENKQFYHYQEPKLTEYLSEMITRSIPYENHHVVVICIGTDRSTGDSLGPLTGTLLSENNHSNMTIYGTLANPVHAVNLQEKIKEIHTTYKKPYIIAIDACLGKMKNVGFIMAAAGPLSPGKALKKDLSKVGDMHITGIVNVGGFMEYLVLQNTRLHTVMEMAKKMAEILHQVDIRLSNRENKKVIN